MNLEKSVLAVLKGLNIEESTAARRYVTILGETERVTETDPNSERDRQSNIGRETETERGEAERERKIQR